MGISRRGFLGTTTATDAAPMLMLPGRAATLGSGSHVYEFEPDWGKLPNGKRYGYTHGVVITHPGDNPEIRCSNIPHEMRTTGEFVSPHAPCWDTQDNVYVVEWIPDGRVTKLRRV